MLKYLGKEGAVNSSQMARRIRTDSDTIERVGVGLSKRSRNVRTIGGNREVARIVTDRVERGAALKTRKR